MEVVEKLTIEGLFSERVNGLTPSMTLELNDLAEKMKADGHKVYNLTAGQLPFKPSVKFMEALEGEIKFLKSYQYSPVAGYAELTEKILSYYSEARNQEAMKDKFGVQVSSGGKHALANIFATLLNPGDEVIILAPYWITYPELVKLNGGVARIVNTSLYDLFVPDLEEIRSMINDKTKAVIINSPNNPSGIFYDEEWMKGFAKLMEDHPSIVAISDELYAELNYYDPAPTFFYQYNDELLDRTIIVHGISMNMACTGLRIGYTLAPKVLIKAMNKLQGQTASGSNSLIQRALTQFDFDEIELYLKPIKEHIRSNARIVQEQFREAGIGSTWYPTTSAFYYLVDFTKSGLLQKIRDREGDKEDYSIEICRYILEETGVAMVPGAAFGISNMARISLVMEKVPFEEAVEKIVSTLKL